MSTGLEGNINYPIKHTKRSNNIMYHHYVMAGSQDAFNYL